MKKVLKTIILMCLAVLLVSGVGHMDVRADDTYFTVGDNGDDQISDSDRQTADNELYYYANSIQVQYSPNTIQTQRLYSELNSAIYYIANSTMTRSALRAYIDTEKATLNGICTYVTETEVTSEYVAVADNWETPSASYGQQVTIVLPIINLGTEELDDLTITPEVSTEVTKWPFVPDQTGYVQTEPYIPGYINDEYAFANRREFTYTFTVRDDVMTGFYPLAFDVSYTRAGIRCEKASVLTVYVKTTGKVGSGYIGGNGNEDKVAKSRIIVTGYDTDKDKIYSGEDFDLTIHVQNTSSTVTVTNVLFGLSSEDSVTSGTTTDKITPFLPKSGSNSVYVASIEPGEIKDLEIQMSAKAGLSQKSYVLTMDMTYDSGTQYDVTDKASISIPVYQIATFDTSNVEATPASIGVGSQSDVMFSIYNTGKTTLYNVKVIFEADSIENNMAFVGNLTSGSTGNVDIMLTGVSPTMDDGTVNMTISYEDEAGNETTEERTCTIYVTDMSADAASAGMRDMEMEDTEEKDHSGLIRGIIVAVVIIVLIAAGIFIYIRKNKKKQAAIHEEDLKDLEDLASIENSENTEITDIKDNNEVQ